MNEQLKIDLTNLSRTKLLKIAGEKDIDLKNLWAKIKLSIILKLMCDGQNPFEINRRPTINETPQIISAQFLDDSICRIQFVSLGKVKKIREGYDLRIIHDTIYIDALLNLDNRTLEVRTEHSAAVKTAETFFKNLNKRNGYEHGFRQIEIDRATVIKLKGELKGGINDHTGKVKSGKSIYDSVKVKGSPEIKDLSEEKEFQKDLEGMDTTAAGIRFISPVTGDRVNIEVGIKSSSIFFRSHVSEQDIKFVCDKLIGISHK